MKAAVLDVMLDLPQLKVYSKNLDLGVFAPNVKKVTIVIVLDYDYVNDTREDATPVTDISELLRAKELQLAERCPVRLAELLKDVLELLKDPLHQLC